MSETEPVVESEPTPEVPVETRIRGCQGRPFMDDESVLRFDSLKQSHDFTSIEEEWDWILECIDEINGHRARPTEDAIHDKFCLPSSPDFLFDKDDIADWGAVRVAVMKAMGLWSEGLDLSP